MADFAAAPAEEEIVLPPLSALESGAEAVVGRDGKKYRNTSLCLRPAHFPRKQCILLIESRWFDPLVLTIIGLNCVTMALKSPLDPTGTFKEAAINVRARAPSASAAPSAAASCLAHVTDV
jgi:hypothetical protein